MHCENCGVEVTFRDGLRQPTPFHFKCTKCGARHRVRTPYMGSIVIGVTVASALAAGAVVGAAILLGPYSLLVSIPLCVGGWLGLEVWTHEYISRNGEFEQF